MRAIDFGSTNMLIHAIVFENEAKQYMAFLHATSWEGWVNW
jgi:hypothetical protein